ncbi:hypothetical protein M9458_035316, partial [Cirrhinus mrigala]
GEDENNPHPVPSQKHLSAPTHPKPATRPSTSLRIGTVSSAPEFSQVSIPESTPECQSSSKFAPETMPPLISAKKMRLRKSRPPESAPVHISELTESHMVLPLEFSAPILPPVPAPPERPPVPTSPVHLPASAPPEHTLVFSAPLQELNLEPTLVTDAGIENATLGVFTLALLCVWAAHMP